MVHHSPLQKFCAAHPMASLAIVARTDDMIEPTAAMPHEWAPCDIVWQTRVIATFTRRRDAWRALHRCGYREEGCFWRLVPASEQPLTRVSVEVSDMIGDL